ncbi:thioredoxin [Glycomyces sp. TRM65418]|uniref:thioredoxin n=1 Tax=Glycomyces sp. TRM65418 TaxID=2867006 RepID=UPI001CE5D389|nr:thioredoxin [Glycomyces sp. TRM65418]MCC3761969.1 thioredoxin [Glycomyces sp. TRM65418]QZD56045.1 thioredoxin [Glycomyces sp. TRM65418]
MATVALTKDNFEETVTGNGIVLVDWWADWCGPCKMFAPTFEASSEKHADVVFGKIDTEDQPELSAEAGIQSIPTLMAFRDGILLYSQPGALPPAALEEIIGKVKELDMDAVRAEIEKEEAAGGHDHGDHEGHRH